MSKDAFLKLFAAAGLILSGPASAQITQIDPNDAGEYEPAASVPASEPAPYAPYEAPPASDYVPLDSAPPASTPSTAPAPGAPAGTTRGDTVPRDDVFSAAEGVFGKGAEGLANLIEKILKDQGQPSAYIAGQEAGGAFVVGVRYGSGTMHHQVEGQRAVYWTGPSVGFDFGADANKVFVLVYNLHDSQDLFKRFPGAEGNAYVVGGFTASYHRQGDIVLIPVRLGVGLRLGINAGYMRFSEKNRWVPF
ncbi:EipA family protein [Sphingomonas sp. LY54]|uniref:DUF1134 domain-containing protein n=1 Tax=Sphingomonas sp. LY54 TaxID=3095343 RepID=UPI002D766303|nr:EipA family protein [Sphingomonas sp. LY54]WRP27195.1 EipA family protein [Sphingomonas sp. LY54]